MRKVAIIGLILLALLSTSPLAVSAQTTTCSVAGGSIICHTEPIFYLYMDGVPYSGPYTADGCNWAIVGANLADVLYNRSHPDAPIHHRYLCVPR